MNKDGKGEKSFHDRLKKFLKFDKKAIPHDRVLRLSEHVKFELSKESPLSIRLKAMKELGEELHSKRLEELGVQKIWMLIKDLLSSTTPAAQRQATLQFLSLVVANPVKLGISRLYLFEHVCSCYQQEDTVPLFNFFTALINQGKDIEYIEETVGSFLADWLPSLFSAVTPTTPVLNIVINVLRFHSAYLDEDIVHKLIRECIAQLMKSNTYEEIHACLRLMDSILAYSYLPSQSVTLFITCLARLVSTPSLVDEAWKVMRNLLRTHMGNTVLLTLCDTIENSNNFHHVRGCIFFLTSALWTSSRVTTLTFRPMAVLPTLKRASESGHPLVVYQTAIAINRLVGTRSSELHIGCWAIILEILSRLFFYTANYPNKEQAQMIFSELNNVLDVIEECIETRCFHGDLFIFQTLSDVYSDQRQVPSVLKNMDRQEEGLDVSDPHWASYFASFIQKYFQQDPRLNIRIQAVAKIKSIFDRYSCAARVQIVDIVIRLFDDITLESEVAVRKAAVSLLIHMVLNLSHPEDSVLGLLTLVEKIVLHPYAKPSLHAMTEEEAQDVAEGVSGLINVFKKKIWILPSIYSITAFNILMMYAEMHYRNQLIQDKVPDIRKMVFEVIFELRADVNYHLGLPRCPDAQLPMEPDDCPILKLLLPSYTPYIVVDHKRGRKHYRHEPDKSPTARVGPSGNENKDLDVQIVAISSLSSDGASVVEPAAVECEVPVRKPSGELSTKEAVCISDAGSAASENTTCAVESAGSTTCNSAGNENCSAGTEDGLEFDVNSLQPTKEVTHVSLMKAAMIVIVAMKKEKDWTLLKMILEQVPKVLQNKALILSRDGTDVDYLATTLCSLILDRSLGFPECLRNTPPRFMSSDFNSYVYPVLASLASYHQHLDPQYQKNVIQCLNLGMLSKSSPQCVSAMTLCALEMGTAMSKLLPAVMITLSKISTTIQNAQPSLEFLSTLLHLPRVYANFSSQEYLSVFAIAIPYTNPFKFNHYIVSLAYHVIAMWFLKCRLPFRRGYVGFISKSLHMILENEESSNKKKCTDQNSSKDMDMIQFHKDLRETCVDLMSRYTFSSYAPMPSRSPVADMLVNRGLQQMWLVGTRLISVTTSGCLQRPFRNGICDKCATLCSLNSEGSQPLECPPVQDQVGIRRRHRSEFQRSISHEVKPILPKTKDDLHMRQFTREVSQPLGSQLDQVAEQPIWQKDQVSSDIGGAESGQSSDYNLPYGSSRGNISHAGKDEPQLCACWCRGWAEVYIRQPTGNISYMVRIQNAQTLVSEESEVPIFDLCDILDPLAKNAEDSPFSREKDLDNSKAMQEAFIKTARPRAFSGLSDKSQHSEPGMVSHGIWSNGGSAPSSGAVSLNSSELRLHPQTEGLLITTPGSADGSRVPVQRCYSSPEVSEGIINHACLDVLHVGDQNLAVDDQKESAARQLGTEYQSSISSDHSAACSPVPKSDQCPSSPSGYDSTCSTPVSSQEEPAILMKNPHLASSAISVSQSSLPSSVTHSSFAEKSSESVSYCASLRRSSSSAGSSSPLPPVVTRTRHASAMQMKTSSVSSNATSQERDLEAVDPTLQPMKRGRGHTISDTNPASRKLLQRQALANRRPTLAHTGSLGLTNEASTVYGSEMQVSTEPSSSLTSSSQQLNSSNFGSHKSMSGRSSMKDLRGGISPSSVFLQLYYQGCLGCGFQRPILLPLQQPEIQRAIKVLDLVQPQENHKIGVLYVGVGQVSEADILRNTSGPQRYLNFIEGLGSVLSMNDVKEDTFLGGLDRSGVDGHVVYMWQDDIMQVVFHVATAMPNKDTDLNCNNKKRHIGNNFVTIVYNNSGHPYKLSTIKSQFNHSVIEIVPGDHNTNCVGILCRPDLKDFVIGSNDSPRLVSDINLPILVRQLALHANLASMVWESLSHQPPHPYASNWLERLHKIRKIREKILGPAEAHRQLLEQQRQQQLFSSDSLSSRDAYVSSQPTLDFTDMIETKDADKMPSRDKSRTAGFLSKS